jgi:GWxTD domain-containing protein
MPSRLLIASLLTLGAATRADAQVPRPLRASGDPVARRADSVAAAGDSAAALALLEAEVRTKPRNAAAWHQLGLLQWSMAAANRRGGYIADGVTINRLRGADSALRLATKHAPDSAQYWVSLARFNLQSDVGSMHFAASREMENAHKAATAVGDSVFMAMGSDEIGMAIWRRYETIANRAISTNNQTLQLATNASWRRSRAKDHLETFAKKIEPPTGTADYIMALERFRDAVAIDPVNLRYSRHLFMALAERGRWPELLATATARAAKAPFDAQARFAAGLALQRLGRTALARAAFDSAIALSDPAEMAALFNIRRVVPPGANPATGKRSADSASIGALSAEQRETFGRLYWLLNDPLMSTAENEHLLEFQARVVHAELRWTDDDLGLRGADTDRGDIFIRFGPPDEEMTIAGKASVQIATIKDTKDAHNVMATREDAGATLAWIYRSGEVYFFDMAMGFGTARLPVPDIQYVQDMQNIKPVSWDNLGLATKVDSMDVRLTRFRAGRDSGDVVVAANVSLESLLRDVEIADPEVAIDFRIYDASARTHGAESTRRALAADSVTKSATRSWVRRIGNGLNIVRVEAMQRDVGRATRATLRAERDTDEGFGLSDILLAKPGTAPPPSDATTWRMLGVEPSNGVYRAGEKIGLAWEVYALAANANTNRYRVAITIERVQSTGAAAMAMRVLDRVGGLLRQGESGSERLELSFDRSVAARGTQVDYVALDWIAETRGTYRLRVAITDQQTQETRSRETTFTMR